MLEKIGAFLLDFFYRFVYLNYFEILYIEDQINNSRMRPFGNACDS
jgi:hypothetical protein